MTKKSKKLTYGNLIDLLRDSLTITCNLEQEIDFASVQFYWQLAPSQLFDPGTIPQGKPTLEDVQFDLETLQIEIEEGVSSPLFVLMKLSSVLNAIARDTDELPTTDAERQKDTI